MFSINGLETLDVKVLLSGDEVLASTEVMLSSVNENKLKRHSCLGKGEDFNDMRRIGRRLYLYRGELLGENGAYLIFRFNLDIPDRWIRVIQDYYGLGVRFFADSGDSGCVLLVTKAGRYKKAPVNYLRGQAKSLALAIAKSYLGGNGR